MSRRPKKIRDTVVIRNVPIEAFKYDTLVSKRIKPKTLITRMLATLPYWSYALFAVELENETEKKVFILFDSTANTFITDPIYIAAKAENWIQHTIDNLGYETLRLRNLGYGVTLNTAGELLIIYANKYATDGWNVTNWNWHNGDIARTLTVNIDKTDYANLEELLEEIKYKGGLKGLWKKFLQKKSSQAVQQLKSSIVNKTNENEN